MGFFKNLIHTIFPSPDDDDEELLEQEEQEEKKDPLPREKKKTLSVEEQLRAKPGQRFFQEKRFAREGTPLKENKTLSMPMDDKRLGATIFYPTNFDDSQAIADCLRSKKMVILNFEKTDNLLAKRMTDFISGTTYALGGSMKKIGHKILLCAPKNIDIDSEASLYTCKGDEPWKK